MRTCRIPWLLVASLLYVWAAAAAAQCTIDGTVDIVWMIDASKDVAVKPGGIDPLEQVRLAMTKFADHTVMGQQQVRQSYVVFSGDVDPQLSSDWESFELIGPILEFSEPAATSKKEFIQSVDSNIVYMGGTRDIAKAINFVRSSIITDDENRPNAKRLLILLLSGPATDTMGNIASSRTTENALNSLYDKGNVQTLMLTMGDAFPEGYLRSYIDFTFPTKYETLVHDFIDSGVFCYFFQTEAPIAPSIDTPAPTTAIGPGCFP